MEDQKIIWDILNGDHQSIATLHRRYVDHIFNYIYVQTNNYHDAEELLQDVFFKIATQLHQFEGKASFKTWAFKIARNVVIDYYRKNKGKVNQTSIDENTIEKFHHEESAEHTVLRHIQMDEVKQALDTLPKHYHAVLHLRFVEGFSINETAEIMGKTVLSVKAMQRRARKALSEHINMEVTAHEES